MAARCSVVLAAFQGERFIEEQLGSILDQSRPPDEVLVGDDASTDATASVVERVAARHPRGGSVRLVRRERGLGLVGNFEDLLGRASGELVALADQDDRWALDRLERLLPRFDDEPELLLLHHDARLVDAAGAPIGGLFDSLRIGDDALADERAGRGFERLLRRNLVTGATTVLRASLLPLAGRVPEGWIHDEWLAIISAALGGLGVEVAQLVDYRQHGGNQIGASSLDARGVLARFREDGVERNRRLLVRAASLAERLPAVPGVPAARIRLAEQKLDHERARAALPRSRARRIGPALAEWRTGRYAEFGNGLPDLARDLVQPRREGSGATG